MDYKEAGVDIEAGYEVVNRVKKLSKSTYNKNVLGDIGSFGGLFLFDKDKYKKPVLVSGTDGVGTKLKIAFLMNKHNTIGIDAVAMCVNDVAVLGAKPLFFLDYLAFNKVDPNLAEQILQGIVEGCKMSGSVLIGGETAEMSDMYSKGEYDIAGFSVGVVEKSKIINGSKIKIGDKIIGISSSGLHSNGFTLARKVLLEKANLKVEQFIDELGGTLGEILLTPTKIYVNTILSLIEKVEVLGFAHITGGGLFENVSRILPRDVDAKINSDSWPKQKIFEFIAKKGQIKVEEMYKAFNMGIGLVAVVRPFDAEKTIEVLKNLGENGYLIGEIIPGSGKVSIS